MTMIKKDGHWVTVAGGQRMWVGTKAQLDAALAAGELEDGTAVMVTDDYEEASSGHPHPDWANAVAITVAQLYAGYTAPSDGMLVCSGVMPSADTTGTREIFINNVRVVRSNRASAQAFSHTDVQCPVSSGDLIKSNTDNAWSIEVRYFVPWK